MTGESDDKTFDEQPVDGADKTPSGDSSIVQSDPFTETSAPRAQEATEKIDTLLSYGRYRVVRKVGEGGFGAVFLGHDDQLDRAVAIKVAARRRSSSEADEFLQEARRLAKLKHPAVLTRL
ncbi:MAG: hypothetical protein CMJ64_15655 [Planctomycetaceae bacterium]|nr:hypothetical protein [Planctomycetaceae bacterium]